MTTAVYLRVSTHDQDVAAQRRVVERFLRERHMEVASELWYVDSGYSGKNVDRPALRQLKAAVSAGSIEIVVVYALDRLARRILDGIELIVHWLQGGTRIMSVREDLDFGGDVGQIIAGVLFGVAQMERTIARERQAHGIENARAKQAAVKAAVKAGAALCLTARQVGVSLETARKMLASPDENLWYTQGGPRPPRKKNVTAERIGALTQKGLTQGEIAASLGCSTRTLRRRMKRNGHSALDA